MWFKQTRRFFACGHYNSFSWTFVELSFFCRFVDHFSLCAYLLFLHMRLTISTISKFEKWNRPNFSLNHSGNRKRPTHIFQFFFSHFCYRSQIWLFFSKKCLIKSAAVGSSRRCLNRLKMKTQNVSESINEHIKWWTKCNWITKWNDNTKAQFAQPQQNWKWKWKSKVYNLLIIIVWNEFSCVSFSPFHLIVHVCAANATAADERGNEASEETREQRKETYSAFHKQRMDGENIQVHRA